MTEKFPLTCTETEGKVTNLKVIYMQLHDIGYWHEPSAFAGLITQQGIPHSMLKME